MSGDQKGNAGQSGQGNAQQSDPSTTIGVGGPTSGEAGATPAHETQAETGGSGGSGLTRNDPKQAAGLDAEARARQSAGDSAMNVQNRPTSGGPTDAVVSPAGRVTVDSGARGFQDTRSQQAGGTGSGLGTPETGANQTPEDIEKGR